MAVPRRSDNVFFGKYTRINPADKEIQIISDDSSFESDNTSNESSNEFETQESKEKMKKIKRGSPWTKKTSARELNIASNKRRIPIWIGDDPNFYLYHSNKKYISRYAIKCYDSRLIVGFLDLATGNYYDAISIFEKILDEECTIDEIMEKKHVKCDYYLH